MSCGVGHRRGLDLVLLWLWRRPAATAPIRPLGWEPPYATAMALKGKKERKEKKERKKKNFPCSPTSDTSPQYPKLFDHGLALTSPQLVWGQVT